MQKNCIDSPCKYCTYVFTESYDDNYCIKKKCRVPDNIDETDCDSFELAKTCLDCKYSLPTTYETGTIDDIEYRCPYQNNEMIYDDLNPNVDHYSDIPECNVGKFELEE